MRRIHPVIPASVVPVRRRRGLLVLVITGVMAMSAGVAPARAGLVIDPGIAITSTPDQYFDSSITSLGNYQAVESTIITAIQTYENLFTNTLGTPVKIYFKSMSTGLGQSDSVYYDTTYHDFRTGLSNNDAVSHNADQGTALAHLPNQLTNPVTGNDSTLAVTSANGRILGLNTPGALGTDSQLNHGDYDGVISIRTAITFPPQPQGASTFSLLAVAEHEIDEVLGTGSGLNLSPITPSAADLYRFQGNSTNRSFTTSGTASAWFSIDGGQTDLVQYNQNSAGDYGDWKSSGTPKVQDAFGSPNKTPTILNDGGAEVRLLNVLGYNLSTAVPEPSGLSLLGSGTLALFAVAWRRRSRPVDRKAD